MSRRDHRKLERVENKKRKAEHHATNQRRQHKRPVQEAHEGAPVAKKPRFSAPSPKTKTSNRKPEKRTPLQKLVDESSDYPGVSRTQEEDREDAYIRYLEDRLGWKKNGTKTTAYGSGLADAGLDGMYKTFSAISVSLAKFFAYRSTCQLGYLQFVGCA